MLLSELMVQPRLVQSRRGILLSYPVCSTGDDGKKYRLCITFTFLICISNSTCLVSLLLSCIFSTI